MRLKNSAETFSHGIPIVLPAIRWTEVKVIYLLDTGKLASLKFPTFWCDNTSQGKFMLNMAFGQSKYYVDSLSENTKRGLRQKVRNGNISKPSASGIFKRFAEQKHIVVDKKKSKIIRLAFENT